jgi:GAF domain-containing protein
MLLPVLSTYAVQPGGEDARPDASGTSSQRGPAPGFHQGLLELIAQIVFMEGRSDLSSFYRRVCRLAAESVGARGSVILLAESGGRSLISISAYDATTLQVPGKRFAIGVGVAGAAFQSGCIEIHSDAVPHRAYIPPMSGRSGEAIIAIPIVRPGEAVEGVLCIHGPQVGEEFASEAVAFAASMGESLSHALRIVRFGDHLHLSNENLRAGADRTAALYSLATQVLDDYPLEEILDEAARAIVRLFRFERIGIFLAHGPRLVSAATIGLPERLAVGRSFSLDQLALEGIDGVSERAASAPVERAGGADGGRGAAPEEARYRDGGDILVRVAAEALRHRRTTRVGGGTLGSRERTVIAREPRGFRRASLVSACAVPMESDGRLLGAIVAARALEDDRAISDEDASGIRFFASQIALLVDQAERRDRGLLSPARGLVRVSDVVERENSSGFLRASGTRDQA